MDDAIYRTRKCVLILMMFRLRIQDSILVSELCRNINYVVHLLSALVSFISLKPCFRNKYIYS